MNLRKHLAKAAYKDGWFYGLCGNVFLESRIMSAEVIRGVRPDNLCKSCYNTYDYHNVLKERNII